MGENKVSDLERFVQDKATGFLESREEGAFNAKAKTSFLKALKIHGNQSKAAHDLGFSYKNVADALRKDLIFNEAFQETLLEMRHKLESELYKAGIAGKSKDALVWLSAHFPNDYGTKKTAVPKKPSNQEIDSLFEKLGG